MYKHVNHYFTKILLINYRFDTTISSWRGGDFLAFIVIFLKNFHKSN